MNNLWNDSDLHALMGALAERTYSSRLLGSDKGLVLYGGGNTSVKGTLTNVLGEEVAAVFVKASGCHLADMTADDHLPLDLKWLRHLESLESLTDEAMAATVATRMLRATHRRPSIEALLHVFLPFTYIDHTHPQAILALTNRAHGAALVRQVLGAEVAIVPYVKPGFALAKAVVTAWREQPDCKAMVLMHHGLITWGESGRASYEATIQLVNRAENYLRNFQEPVEESTWDLTTAWQNYEQLAPALRGALCQAMGDSDGERVVLKPLIHANLLAMMAQPHWQQVLVTPPITSDYLIRTKPLPMVVEEGESPRQAMTRYGKAYEDYLRRQGHAGEGVDVTPRIIFLPGVGAVCVGKSQQEADLVWDITWQGLEVKAAIVASGGEPEGLAEKELFAMEYYFLQQAKVAGSKEPLSGRTALITGAAGAIGAGICRGLLLAGCHVLATDINEGGLSALVNELAEEFPGRVRGCVMDVTRRESVALAISDLVRHWGGLDLLILNAGVAHVSTLEKMDGEIFRRLEQINVEGTLNPLSVAAGHFRQQGMGGDVVLISTKNVFAPGAGFGAYSATKAASHQLARIASLEMAEMGVRVNMVAPDAVFSDGQRKSGLWAEVGPDRMRARGLDEQGLEEYYRQRNLLKSKVTANHVANAVLFFATRQTPTTGATIPVDGGLPDATPR
ncbi:MAG: SDR family NAD(P)-dependent oxidoreductase [Magnetococcales bacterium]|nr:SDR family NAD(P)-dependent oxidoreductase [Magnetococcales bacterium]